MSTAPSRLRAERAAAPRRAAAHAAGDPGRAPDSERRPSLEVVGASRRRARRRKIVPTLSAVMVSLSLFVVVIGHAELAQGQVRLSAVDTAITAAQVVHHREVLSLATAENPSRVLRAAEETLHMAPPGQIHQLPYVPLGVPLPTPNVAPAATQETPTSPTGT